MNLAFFGGEREESRFIGKKAEPRTGSSEGRGIEPPAESDYCVIHEREMLQKRAFVTQKHFFVWFKKSQMNLAFLAEKEKSPDSSGRRLSPEREVRKGEG